MNLSPVKFKHRYSSTGPLHELCRRIGVPEVLLVGKLWLKGPIHLRQVLQSANEQFKKRSKLVHPRAVWDSQQQASELGSLWMQIRDKINRRLHRKKRMQASLICPWCHRPFTAYRRKKKYCCRKHMHAHAKNRYKQKQYRIHRGTRQKYHRNCQLQDCNRKFTTHLRRKAFHSAKCRNVFNRRRLRAQLKRQLQLAA